MNFKNIEKAFSVIDPYTYLDLLLFKILGDAKDLKTKIIYWIVYIAFSFLLAWTIYKLIGLILGTSMPMVVVVSGSMEPSFYRGDIIILKGIKEIKADVITIDENIEAKNLSEYSASKFIKNKYNLEQIEYIEFTNNQKIEIKDTLNNDVVVYNSNLNGRDIIHRAIAVIKTPYGKYVLTKGDNNMTNRTIDQDCKINDLGQIYGCLNMYAIKQTELKGKKIGKIPYLGYLKLFLFS
ncbi:MAG: hypothetical protein V1824_01820 [archaeon]